MADFNGVKFEFAQAERGLLYVFPNTSPVVEKWPVYDFFVGTRATPARIVTTKGVIGTKPPLMHANDVIFGNIFMTPMEIDAGFITEKKNYSISVWNSDYENIATVSQITKINEGGTEFDHDTLPISIIRSDAKVFDFSVLKEGPAVQDTHFVFTIGAVYDVYVYGIRIVAWTWEPNWKNKVGIEYKMQTIVHRTPRFVEQRRPLFDEPERHISCTFLRVDLEAQKFINDTSMLAKKILAIPVYSEPMLPVADLQGLTTINFADSVQYFWNLQKLATLVLIKSISDPDFSELKEINSVGTDHVTLLVSVLGDFKADDTVLYPVLIGIIQQKKHKKPNIGMVESNLKFREVAI